MGRRHSWFEAETEKRLVEICHSRLVILPAMGDPFVQQLVDRSFEPVNRGNRRSERNGTFRLRIEVVAKIKIKRFWRHLGDSFLSPRRNQDERATRGTMQALVRRREQEVN